MENEKLSKITGMLLAGGKMLSIHCATCLGPLFEFEGKITCAVCGDLSKPQKVDAKPASLDKVESVLISKLNSLAEELEKEANHSKILELLDRIKSMLDALHRLRK